MTPADFCNKLSGNSIHSNSLLGIDLWPEGVTSNDPGDIDLTSNAGMNFPEILSSSYNSGTGETTITGILNTPFPDHCIVEFFLADGDPSSHGEGITFAGSLTPLANGTFTHTFQAPFICNLLTATATDSCGNTSEFSENHLLPPPNQIISDDDLFNKVSVFPNPVSDILQIHNNNNHPVAIEVFSGEGQLIISESVQQGIHYLYVRNWKTGTYFMVTDRQYLQTIVISRR